MQDKIKRIIQLCQTALEEYAEGKSMDLFLCLATGDMSTDFLEFRNCSCGDIRKNHLAIWGHVSNDIEPVKNVLEMLVV